MTKEVIGIIGPIGSGKDIAGDYIADKLNVPSYQISSPLKQICADTGIEATRENLIALGTNLAKEYHDGYLAEYILERMPDRGIITGMRQLGQIKFLKSSAKLTLISISAEPTVRFERVKKNDKLGEAKTLDEFIERENAENSPPNAQRLFECMKLADYHVVNDGSVEELYARLDEIIAE